MAMELPPGVDLVFDECPTGCFVINNYIYDLKRLYKFHPGGARILSHFAGQDATSEIQLDFDNIRIQAIKEGLFSAEFGFFAFHLMHILLLEVVAYLALSMFGTGWLPYLFAVLVLTTAQAQAGWTQHDYGHQSVLPNSRWNHIFQYFILGFLKGAGCHWWNFRHNQHHAKPNVAWKDPDITLPHVFLLGKTIPAEWAAKKKGGTHYDWQHIYFVLTFPPLLLPIYFHYENIYFMWKRRGWRDFLLANAFFAKLSFLYVPLLGHWGTFCFYMFVRVLESHWFSYVTQMNHLPMDVKRDSPGRSWVETQLEGTCNVEPSVFNDWFTGHLNFQIEHHLFPTMPRHNYYKIQPRVKELCRKYGITYQSKTLLQAFADIIRSLKKSGQIWSDVYYGPQ